MTGGPKLDYAVGEKRFAHIQSRPFLVQLEAVSSCPIICYLWEETNLIWLSPPYREILLSGNRQAIHTDHTATLSLTKSITFSYKVTAPAICSSLLCISQLPPSPCHPKSMLEAMSTHWTEGSHSKSPLTLKPMEPWLFSAVTSESVSTEQHAWLHGNSFYFAMNYINQLLCKLLN